jgi:bifunctional non-homologous end joining protein LigD
MALTSAGLPPAFRAVCRSGLTRASAADLRERLTPLVRKTQPYSRRIAHKGIWVEPNLLAEIEYRAKSAEGKVRHPFFRGLREDLG